MAPDREPYGECDELGEQERLQKPEGGVAASARRKTRATRVTTRPISVAHLAIVGGGKRDRTPGRKLGSDAGSEVGGDVGFGHGFESADDALIQMLLICERIATESSGFSGSSHVALLSLCLTLLKGFT